MMPRREVLVRLVRANISFLLYGQKAAGKTTMVQKVLKEANANHIEINCTLANKKTNFLKLFNVELNKYLSLHCPDFQKLKDPHSLDNWITEIKKNINDNHDLIGHLDNLYIFMDNI
jgi:Cdc6-like AAA superfamily ATPase